MQDAANPAAERGRRPGRIPAQPRPVDRPVQPPGAGAHHPARAWPAGAARARRRSSPRSTSTSSSASTSPRPPCRRPGPGGDHRQPAKPCCARATCWRASATTSSCCCCPASATTAWRATACASCCRRSPRVQGPAPGGVIPLTCSIGYAIFPQDGDQADALLGNAALATRRAKELGGGQIQHFSERAQAGRRPQAGAGKPAARAPSSPDELFLVYQPKIELKRRGGRPRGAAALAPSGTRHHLAGGIHPDRRGVRPDRARSANGCCAAPSTSAAPGARPACRRPCRWRSTCRRASSSHRHRRHRRRRAARAGLGAGHLELELTESMSIGDPRAQRRPDARSCAPRRHAQHRRFRHRLFEPQLPEAPAGRQAQDRPLLRAGHAPERRIAGDGEGHHRDGAQPAPGGDRRGRRVAGAARRDCAPAGCDQIQGFYFSSRSTPTPAPSTCAWHPAPRP
jgi:hypothetical protein